MLNQCATQQGTAHYSATSHFGAEHSYSPTRGLLLCRVTKVASSVLADVMCSMAHGDTQRTKTPGLHRPFNVSTFEEGCDWWTLSPSPKAGVKLENLVASPSVKLFTFVRDPLERFLSAYLSKCAPDAGDGDHESICSAVFGKWPISFEQAVGMLRCQGFCQLKSHGCDHFVPQAHLCGYLPARAHVVQLGRTRAEVGSQLSSMLKQVGVEANKVPAFTRHFPTVTDQAAVALLPVADAHATGAHARLQHYYRTDDLIRAVLEHYAMDYTRFRIPVPQWAAERVGTLFLGSVGISHQGASDAPAAQDSE